MQRRRTAPWERGESSCPLRGSVDGLHQAEERGTCIDIVDAYRHALDRRSHDLRPDHIGERIDRGRSQSNQDSAHKASLRLIRELLDDVGALDEADAFRNHTEGDAVARKGSVRRCISSGVYESMVLRHRLIIRLSQSCPV